MSVLITICARAGSKGLPGKHMKLFNGKPLIQWTIEQAMECGLGSVYVSTDDVDIFKIAMDFQLGYILRKAELSQDNTPKLDVLRDVLRNTLGQYDTLIDLDATNPCRTVGHILEAKWKFDKEKSDVLFSVTRAKKSPWFNQVEISKSGMTMLVNDPVNVPTSRQEAEKLESEEYEGIFDMNSSIYVYTTKWLEYKKHLHPVCFNSRAYVMPPWTFCDIDDEKDFVAAEALHRKYCLEGGRA